MRKKHIPPKHESAFGGVCQASSGIRLLHKCFLLLLLLLNAHLSDMLFKDECMKLTASCLVNAACERIMTGSKFETGVHYWANSTIAEPHKNPIFMSVCARVLLSNRGCHCFHV